jgi:hypothetical protein
VLFGKKDNSKGFFESAQTKESLHRVPDFCWDDGLLRCLAPGFIRRLCGFKVLGGKTLAHKSKPS